MKLEEAQKLIENYSVVDLVMKYVDPADNHREKAVREWFVYTRDLIQAAKIVGAADERKRLKSLYITLAANCVKLDLPYSESMTLIPTRILEK